MNSELISNATLELQEYIESQQYRGFDPYDALKSPLFHLPFFKSNSIIRFLAQQFVKRFPFSLRSVLFIKKGYNPVTLGLCIQAYTNCLFVFPSEKKKYEEKINYLVDELEKLIPSGFSGACWGYDFDWQSRYAKISGYQPTVVATGIVANALFHAFHATGNKKARELCVSASEFILKDLHRIYDQENKNFCFSYSPFDHEVVFNASMKAARTLSQVYSLTKDERLKSEAQKAVTFVVNCQQKNGSWMYSQSSSGGWIDNYHTGYILDCLDEYIRHTGDSTYATELRKGYEFYKKNFFQDDVVPKFYDKETYPVDCTAAAQSLLTLTRFNNSISAGKVAEWTIENMQSKRGYFYFRKFKSYTIKTSFMRWSNAWMFLGLTEVLRANKQSAN